MKTLNTALALIAAATFVSTCRNRETETSAQASGSSDSVAAPSIESELAAFRSGMTVRPRLLAGAPSRDSLISMLARALADRDTAGLDRLQITREEFAFLYYPDSKMSRPPYELDPQTMWMQIQSQRDRGFRRLVVQYGGRKFRIRGLECAPPDRQNAVVIHQCAVRTKGMADTTAKQLFGSIIERDGRFKFVGYANRL